ncbi:MAG: SigE family RNA polymerase sigma factor [Nocardioides sp.]
MSIQATTSPPAVSDAEAVADAFEEFVRATGRRMMRTALLLCGDHQHAEDLTQTTFATVYARWHLVSRADDPVAYTRTILTRTFFSSRRRRLRELVVAAVPERGGTPVDVPLRVTLLTALGRLPAADRAVLVLRYWEDLSVAQAAAELSISEVACRARASRALGRLRTHYPDLEELR